MSRYFAFICKVTPVVAAAFSVCSCALIPRTPGEAELPIRAIAHRATCELHDAAILMEKKYSFDFTNWAASIDLSPNITAEVNAGLFGSYRNPATGATFSQWVFGSAGAPGAQVDSTGNQTDIIDYKLHMTDLLDPKKFATIRCDVHFGDETVIFPNSLGIAEFVDRIIQSRSNKVYATDNMSVSIDLRIKFNANVSPSYTVIRGPISGTVTGTYTDDEKLTLNLTYSPPTSPSAPGGGHAAGGKQGLTPIHPNARERLDNLNLQQLLRTSPQL
jgi:hypothetical protein